MNKGIIFILFLINSLMTFGSPPLGYEICLKQEIFVNSGFICLGDLAFIRSEDPGLIKKLDEIVIGTAPAQGLVRYFTKYNILGALRREMISTEMAVFTGAQRIRVENGGSADSVSPGDKIVLSLRENACISSEIITLGDILEISPSESSAGEAIRAIAVAKIPAPGFSKEFSMREVISLLKKNRIEMKNIVFSENNSVIVTRPSERISGAEIAEEARKFIYRHFGWDPGTTSVYLKNSISDMVLPEGVVEYQFIPLSSKSPGGLALEVRIMLDAKIYKSLKLNFFIDQTADVLVASADIEKGRVISMNNITCEKRNITLTPELANIRFTDIDGMTAVINIRAGMPVTMKMVENPVLVKKGQAVKIEFRAGGLSITAKGRAMDNGHAGEIIRVKNTDTEKVISGTVFDNQTISVRA